MIPHNRPLLGPEEEKAVRRLLRSGWVAQGPQVAAFEDEFCRFLGLPKGRAVAVASGTAALYLALWALKAKDRAVAFPAYVCSALRHAVAMVGGRERVLDIAAGSPNLDPAALGKCGAKIAIVPHMFGIPVDLSGVKGVEIVEDCAQALGAKVRGGPVGLQGRLGIFSFYATKLMTSGGQGGMVVSKDKALIDALRDFRQFDCRKDAKRRFNFQMTDLQAAVGRAQLKKLPDFLARREAIFRRYAKVYDLLDSTNAGVLPVRYRAVTRTEDPRGLIKALAKRGVRAIVPVEDWELLAPGKKVPNALALTRRTVSLPLYPSLSNKEAAAVAAAAP